MTTIEALRKIDFINSTPDDIRNRFADLTAVAGTGTWA